MANTQTTVLEAIKTQREMPKQIWNGAVNGPISFDDLFELQFWYQKHKNSKPVYFRIAITGFEVQALGVAKVKG